MKEIKNNEREILLKRFFYDDRKIYNLGKAANIEWFNQFDYKFNKDEYAYFADEEKIEVFSKFHINELTDEKFIFALNKIEIPTYIEIDRFIGKSYYFDAKKEKTFKLKDQREILTNELKGVIKDTKKRAYYFLKAIIELYKEKRWDKAYGGVTWIDILTKIRDLGGMYPAPRDIAILKSYRIYYKTGSRRYPTHTIPEEMIDIIENELKDLNIH